MTKLQHALAKKEAWRDALNALGPEDLTEVFAFFFVGHPEVEAIRWQQGLRGLDDGGDPCYDFEYGRDLEDASLGEEAEYAVRDVDFDVLEVVFGQYATVTVSRTGFVIEEG